MYVSKTLCSVTLMEKNSVLSSMSYRRLEFKIKLLKKILRTED